MVLVYFLCKHWMRLGWQITIGISWWEEFQKRGGERTDELIRVGRKHTDWTEKGCQSAAKQANSQCVLPSRDGAGVAMDRGAATQRDARTFDPLSALA